MTHLFFQVRMIIIHSSLLQNVRSFSITSSASAGGHCTAEKRDEFASFQLQDIKLTRISQEVTATGARPARAAQAAAKDDQNSLSNTAMVEGGL
jgi:hypothetical protein